MSNFILAVFCYIVLYLIMLGCVQCTVDPYCDVCPDMICRLFGKQKQIQNILNKKDNVKNRSQIEAVLDVYARFSLLIKFQAVFCAGLICNGCVLMILFIKQMVSPDLEIFKMMHNFFVVDFNNAELLTAIGLSVLVVILLINITGYVILRNKTNSMRGQLNTAFDKILQENNE